MATYYARRIPSGLDGAESCGPDQQFDPNYVFQGIKGQCVPKSQPLVKMASTTPSFFESFMAGMFPKPAAPAAAATAPIVVQQSGMSMNTKIALGVGAVGLVALVLIATRK